MLKDGKFVISFTDLIDDGPFGRLFIAERYSANYFKDTANRQTMCCGCDKGSRE